MKSKLYLIPTPIGNYDDITFRALSILKEVDFIICEEFKIARRLLAHYGINKELISLNEHNESETAEEIFSELSKGKTAGLISDCGTPLFSDPGHILVDLCIQNKIDVIPLPGASSILPALTASGFDFEKFFYYGWLSPKKDIRRKELLRIKNIRETIVIMDTPYRLQPLLSDVSKILGAGTNIVLAFELTSERERFYRGSAAEILSVAEKNNLKGEFVLIIDNK